jgi:hypothetical protein
MEATLQDVYDALQTMNMNIVWGCRLLSMVAGLLLMRLITLRSSV